MPPFRRVDARQAGPTALGILVPPGVRTLVIVRPRSLTLDLLPARLEPGEGATPSFCLFGRDEAAGVARQVFHALGNAVANGINPVETVGNAADTAFQVWARLEDLVWIACPRTPGQAYRPLLFADHAAALECGLQLSAIVWPTGPSEQEVYFNTQHVSPGFAGREGVGSGE